MIKTLSLTIEKHQFDWLKANHLSPTRLLRAKIEEMKSENTINPNLLAEERRKRENWQKMTYRMREFMNKKGVAEEFDKQLES